MRIQRRHSIFVLILVVLLTMALGKLFPGAGIDLADRIATLSGLQPSALESTLATFRDAQEAEQIVQRAWLLAQQAGAYDFRTEIEQTTYHAPALTNVGRPAHVESLYLEGKTDTRAKEFDLAIWQGSSVLHRDHAYEVRTEGEKSYGRPAGGTWTPIDDVTSVFAPGRDALAYLHGIRNVREVSEEASEVTSSLTSGFRQFRFDMDGPVFADYMRLQLEDELRRAGKLPSGITLDTPQIYQGIIGQGEVWLTSEGLPQQLHLNIHFPQSTDGSRVRAAIQTDFTNFDTSKITQADTLLGAIVGGSPLWLANGFSRLGLLDWPAVGMQLGFLAVSACLILLMICFRRKPQLIVVLNLTLMVTMVVAPLLQNSQVAAFQGEQAAARQADEAVQAAQAQQRLAESAGWNPTQAPLKVAEATSALAGTINHTLQNRIYTPLAQTAPASSADSDGDGVADALEPLRCVGATDCDGDGLTDRQEIRLGTRLDNLDTDGDNLRDDLEAKGFAVGSQRWYSDPRNVDTNGDGITDTLECWGENTAPDLSAAPSNQPCNLDTDGDGVPDLFTFDNDGDGVDDSVDLSPFHVTDAAAPYNNSVPFALQSNNLTPNEPLFVDMQLVPTSTNQIAYARNVLDWPKNDTKGQVVRTADTTFATGLPANSYPAGEENGDLRLVPLVEIKMAATDAANILPITSTYSVTRQGVGVQSSQVWLTATVAFQAAEGATVVEFTTLTDKDGVATSVDKVRIVASTCPTSGADLASVVEQATTNQGETWTLSQTALPSLMDGNHALMLQKGSNTLCIPLGDLPNGGLASGQIFDPAWLNAYGVTLRDVADGNGQITHVTAYLPANVVTGQTGGEKQAFGVRMAYWPKDGITSLGAAQEVRLVWMVQLLTDDGSTQVVHIYPNEGWRMAGLSARQDIDVRSTIFYQNPDSPQNEDADMRAIHGRLWSAVSVLDTDFARGAENRISLADETVSTVLESRTAAPASTLRAVSNRFQTQDELARLPGEVTPGILAQFLDNGAYKAGYDHALLLFAREESYKSARWDGGNTLALPSASSTLASYSWKPFRYTGSQWEAFPATDYLDLLSVRLKDAAAQAAFVENTTDSQQRSTIRDGIAFINQMFAMSMLYGANRMVAVDNDPVPAEEATNDLADRLSTINEKVVGATLQILASEISEDFATSLHEASAVRRIVDNFEFASDEVLSAVNERTRLAIFGEVAQGRFDNFKAAFGKTDLSTRVAAAGLAISVVSIGLIVGKLAVSNGTVSGAIDVTLPALGALSGVLTLASEANNLLAARSAAGGLANAIKSAQPLARAAKIAAVVGLVLSAAIAVGIFVTQWVAGAFSITDLGFTTALSGVIAAIIVAVILLAISLIPIVGPIIVAVIAAIDGLIAAACAITKKAGFDLEEATTLNIPRTGGAKLSLCAGITGLATEAVRFLLFSQTVLVGNMQAQDRLTTSNFDLNFSDKEAGFQVGNSFNPSLRVDNKITLPDQPFDWKSLVYFWQFNWDNLDEATHRYDLTTDKSDRKVSAGEMEGDWREMNADGSLTASHRSPGIHYDDPLVMAPTVARLSSAQASVPLTQTGINVPVPLYLREAYANPAQECWTIPAPGFPITPIPVCLIRSDKGTNHIDLQLSYDIFPATLDAFYVPAAVGDGVSLAWGQDGDTTFPVMRDFDGDGLLSSAVSGNDRDDRFWDADGDGLSDLFETQKGTMPGAADSDQDGLSDRMELRIGTDPLKQDTDGDGLLDGEEAFHQDAQGNWTGGWAFTYDMVDGASLSTWVTSDPLSGNGDRDTFTDFQEKVYGLHPRVVSDPTILKLKSQLTEARAPHVLLRFDERDGATIFADGSGLGNHASCSGDACPQAGHEGRFTNGLLFDGVDDGIRMAEAVPLGSGSFTLAVWARRNAIDRPDLLFNTREIERNEQMWMGFGATNQFACGFTADSVLNSPAYTDTDWHHWACTYDLTLPMVVGEVGSVTATLYRDGEVVDQRTFSRGLGYFGSEDWLIGASYHQSGGLGSFGGMLDEFVAVPAALTQDQVRLLMQAQYNADRNRFLVAPGDRLSYEADLENNLLGRTLTGLLSVDAPTGWTNNDNLTTYQLGPAQQESLRGQLTVGEKTPSGAYSVTVTAGAAASMPDVPQASASSPPSVHFRFDNAQSRLVDAFGRQANVRTGTANSAPGVGDGSALQLNGATLLDIPDDAALFDMSNTPYTWSVWVKPDAGAGNTRAIFGQPPAGREWQYANGGVFLRVQNDRDLIFGWGETWNTGPISNALTPATWNHVAVTFDGNTLIVYVNGVQRNLSTPNSRPGARSRLTIGDDSYCGEFELRNVRTKKEGDPGEASAEYVYRFEDDLGNRDTLLNDENADTGEWEPGSGPSNNEWFTDKKRTFCFSGSRVYVYEDDGALGSDDSMSPDVRFDIATPHKVGYNNSNYESFWSPDITGDGTVEFYYEIRNPVLPFKGNLDELRLYGRSLSQEEVQQLYETVSVPYHFTLDDPPGTGVSDISGPGVTFINEGAVADPNVRAVCNSSCPTSGLPGRVNRAASFGYIASDGMQIGQGLRIENLSLPQAAPGFSLWTKPQALGVFLSIYRDGNTLIGSTLYDAQGRFCLAKDSTTQCSGASYPTGAWTHIMVTFDGNAMTLHLNNQEQITIPTSGPAWPGAGTYSIGMAGTNFMGLLDDLRIPYNGSDVAAMLATAPLVSLHLEEEGAEITQWENVGGVSATCSGSACPDAGRRGKVAQSAAFDGMDDGLLIPDSPAFDLDRFTLAAWISPASAPQAGTWQTLIAKSEGDFRNYALYINGDRQIVVTRNCEGGSLLQVTSNNALPVDQFAHVAATYDGSSLSIYINGVRGGFQQVASSNACHNDAPLTIGIPHNASASFYRHFNGLVDEVLVYPDALWSYQIKDLYDTQANWIQEKNGHALFVDAEPPTSTLAPTLPLATNYYPNADVQLGVNAGDASSNITLLELGVSVNGGPVTWAAAEPCQDAAQDGSSPAWCPWFLPSQWGGEGRYTLQTRATDGVGHRESPTESYVIVVDGTPPALAVTQAENSLQSLVAHPQQETAQILRLDGTVSDPAIGADAGSGIAQVWVTLRDAEGDPVGDAPYPATINGARWRLAYPFRQAQVAGLYTLEVWAEDAVGNRSASLTQTLALDGAAPGMILSESASGLPNRAEEFRFITSTTTLAGWLGDQALPPGARYAYRFEESPDLANAQRITFENLLATSGAESAAWCVEINWGCPTLGATGHDGRGLAFDGLYDYLTLPQDVAQTSDFTFAAWVYLDSSDGPLFYAGKDWENYLYFTPTGVFGAPEFFITQDGGQNYQSLRTGSQLPTNQWIHLAFSLASGVGRVYVNGVEQTGNVWINGVDQGNNRLTLTPRDVAGEDNWIGRPKSTRNGGSDFEGFRGTLDQVVIYHRGLGRDEVAVLAADRVAGVASGAVSFTPLWTVAESRLSSPHLSPSLRGQSLYLPLDEVTHPISSTTTLYRNLAGENATGATCTSDHCPQPSGNSPVGAAINFDGQDDVIQLPAELIQGDNLTFAAWIYWRGGTPFQRLFSFGRDGFNGAELWAAGSELYFSLNTQGNRESLTALTGLPTNQWVHVAVTVEGAAARLYLDGVEQGAKDDLAGRLSQIAGDKNLLGNTNSGLSYPFNGMMSDVRLFSQALSVWDLKALRLGNRPLFTLPLDERQAVEGSILADESGWGRSATVYSGEDGANKAVPGIHGPRALDFDGVDDYVRLPAQMGDGFVGSNAAFTFASWIYWRGGEADQANFISPQYIFSFGQDAVASAHLAITGSGLSFSVGSGGGDDPFSSRGGMEIQSPIPTDQWVHVAVSVEPQPADYEPSSIFGVTGGPSIGRIYINGVEQASASLGYTPSSVRGMSNSFLGRSQETGSSYFNGALDDARVYPRALNAAEIGELASTRQHPITLGDNGAWTLNVPTGLEGIYRVDLLGVDQGGQTGYNPTLPPTNQTIDTLAPRVSLTSQTVDRGMRTEYVFRASDLYLSDVETITPCGAEGQVQRRYRWDAHVQGNQQLTELTISCRLVETPAIQTGSICDTAGNCASAEMTYLPAADAAQGNGSSLSAGKRPDALASVGIGYSPSFAQPTQGLLLISNVQPSAPFYAAVNNPIAQQEPTGSAGPADEESGPILHWDFEEGPGNCTVQDRTPNGINGSLINMDCTQAWRTDAPPDQGYSLYLGGGQTGEYLTSAASELFPSGNAPRSLCAWTKSPDGTVNGWAEHMMNYGSPTTSQAFGAMIYTGNTWYAYSHATDLNTQIPADTEWHHHCVVYDGATLSYYLDGQSIASTPLTLDTAANTAMVIGVRPDLVSNTSFDGWIDDVRLYGRALRGDEVQRLYAPAPQSDSPVEAVYPPNTFRFLDLPDTIPTLETPTEITFVATPWNTLTDLTIEVDGDILFSETFGDGGVSERQATVTWLPPGEGVYHVTARATDAVSGTVAISRTLFVDATPPTSVMASDTFTTSTYAWGSNLILSGELTDITGVISATASLVLNGTRTDLVLALNPDVTPTGYLRGNPVYPAAPWRAVWRPSAEGGPVDYTEAVLELTVYDASLNPTTIQHPVVFDLQAPVPDQPVILINGEAAVKNNIYFADSVDLSVAISPTTDASGLSLWYGWSPHITATAEILSAPVDPTNGIQSDQRIELSVADGGQRYFFHVIAVDGLGNSSRQVYGPYLLDAPGMPDFVHMPELHGNQFAGPHRAWQGNGCTLLGIDPRLATPQSLYLTWDESLLHFLWTGADWANDGDLFIYLDTIPDQGSLAAYNPYPSTAQSTVLILPPGENQANPGDGAMYADFALWVMDGELAHLLRWAGDHWIDDGPLEQLGGAYAFSHDPSALYTDLVLPFSRIGSPAERMDLVAFAVDGEEGLSQGLRLWSVLPSANPVDSRRVVANGPTPDQPHRMMLTERYTVPLSAGSCFTPEADLSFSFQDEGDGFSYDPADDAVRLILAEQRLNISPWTELFAPYVDQAWLAEVYCPDHPRALACVGDKAPAPLGAAQLLQRQGLADSAHSPLLPGALVTYTLDYQNPTGSPITLPAYLYTNGDLTNPQAGVRFPAQDWIDGCPGWLSLDLAPGWGSMTFSGEVGDEGVHTVTLEIDPTFGRDGCALAGDTSGSPAHRLIVEHTADDGPPGYVAIAPDFNASGPISATVRGVVRDTSPVPVIEIEVNGNSFTCVDDSPTDGQWACDWDIAATNEGNQPESGSAFTLRARATDIFGQQSAWSTPRLVTIDAQAPEVGTLRIDDGVEAADGAGPILLGNPVLRLSGVVTDSIAPAVIEVCDGDGTNCQPASLSIAPFSVPPAFYAYTDQPETPLSMDDPSVCADGVGLNRTFAVADSFTIVELSVGIRLAHSYRSDLSAVLTAPSGAQVTLFEFDRAVLAENINARFADMGASLLSDDLDSHDLQSSYDSHIYRPAQSLTAFAGQEAEGPWTLTLCDRDQGADAGLMESATLRFVPAVPPPAITGTWSYGEDVSDQDGVIVDKQIFAVDGHRQRSPAPVSVQVMVDNVPPTLTAAEVISRMVVNGSEIALAGTVGDGSGAATVQIVIIDPLGRHTSETLTPTDGAWSYPLVPTLGGLYWISVYATDPAGNVAMVGPFSISVLRPLAVTQEVIPTQDVAAGELVTYTLRVNNVNPDWTAENVRLSMSLSEWLTPVETNGADLAQNLLTWPPIDLSPGEAVTRTVLARLIDNLMITSTITGTLPITDWVNLNGAAIISQPFVEADNLVRQESYPASFTIENIHTQPERTLEKEAYEGEDLAGEEPVTDADAPTPPTEEEPPAQEIEASPQLARTLEIHEGPINSVAFDENRGIATGSEDGTIHIVQNEDGSGITLDNSSGPVNSIAFSPDSEILASGLENGTVEIWAWEAEEIVTVLEGSGGAINSVAWSSDGLLATGGDDGVILIWDALAGETLFALEGHEGAINALSWIPAFIGEGVGYLVSAGDDGTVRLWNVESDQPVLTINDHEGPINDVLWVGQVILSGGDDGTVRLWRLAGDSWKSVTAEPLATLGHEDAINSMLITSESLMVAGSADGVISVWDLSSEEVPAEPALVLRDHAGPVNAVVALDVTLVSGGDDGTMRLWVLAEGE